MADRSELTQTRLKELLDYDPLTGVFYWKKTRARGAKKGQAAGRISQNKTGQWYCRIRVDQKLYLAHRLAWLYSYGEWPCQEIDHRDNDGLNNALSNLRAASRGQNSANTRLHADNLVGFKGVSKRGRRYGASIVLNKRRIHLGYFDAPEEAHEAYIRAAELYFGEFARAA